MSNTLTLNQAAKIVEEVKNKPVILVGELSDNRWATILVMSNTDTTKFVDGLKGLGLNAPIPMGVLDNIDCLDNCCGACEKSKVEAKPEIKPERKHIVREAAKTVEDIRDKYIDSLDEILSNAQYVEAFRQELSKYWDADKLTTRQTRVAITVLHCYGDHAEFSTEDIYDILCGDESQETISYYCKRLCEEQFLEKVKPKTPSAFRHYKVVAHAFYKNLAAVGKRKEFSALTEKVEEIVEG